MRHRTTPPHVESTGSELVRLRRHGLPSQGEILDGPPHADSGVTLDEQIVDPQLSKNSFEFASLCTRVADGGIERAIGLLHMDERLNSEWTLREAT